MRRASLAGPARGHSGGFTLLEMMIVTAVLAVIATMAVPMYARAVDNARVAKAIGELKTIATDIESFRLLNGRYPNSLLEVGWGERTDPWGRGYEYLLYSEQFASGREGRGADGKVTGGDNMAVIKAVTKRQLKRVARAVQARTRTASLRAGNRAPIDLDRNELADILRSRGIDLAKRLIRKNKDLFPLNTAYDLYSMGKDGTSSSRIDNPVSMDDVVRFNDGRYYGLAGDY